MGPRKAAWARGRTVSLGALRDEPLVMLTDDFSLTRKLNQAFLAARIEPRIVARSGHWDFLASMAAAGLGTTFLPQPLAERLQGQDTLAMARLTEPAMDWTMAHIWSPGRYLSHAARAWLAVCDEVLGEGEKR
ncbi:nitrogen assimilation transcriptional regulator [compost metagenome]